MYVKLNSLDRRRFLRGTGVALALPLLECTAAKQLEAKARNADEEIAPRRLACFYFSNGVPMPLREDPAYQDYSWFPHGNGTEFTFTKCMESFEPLRSDLTILSGFSHPASRRVHGHSNADQYLTGAATGQTGPYKNTISLDQEYAGYVGDQTRFASIVLSTDGGTGTPRGTHTISFSRNGRPIPAEHRPKLVFDMLFVTSDEDAARRLALSTSALDDLLVDATSLRNRLSASDQNTLDEYLESVREAEIKVAKAKRWITTPLPTVEDDHLKLEVTPEEPRLYVQTMYEMIYLAFKTDSTRVATYQIGRENGFGISDRLSRAVGFNLAHQLSHETKQPGGWKDFSTFCGFLNEEFARFAMKLKETKEPGGEGSMLDNSLLLFGSASSAFHLSRNYPLVLAGGKRIGFRHGLYLNHAGDNPQGGAWDGGREPWQQDPNKEDRPLADVFLTMLQQLGMPAVEFAGSQTPVVELL